MLTKKTVFLTIFLFVFSPWVLSGGGNIDGANILQFFSFKLLFFDASIFQNIGKESGVVFPTFLPFAIYGVYRLMNAGKIVGIIVCIGLLLFASASAGWLIKLEFYVLVVLLSYFTARGLISLRLQHSQVLRVLLWVGILSIIYEIGQYVHYIQLHYTRDLPTLGTH